MGTLTITGFLEARISEDEAVARAATPGPWEWEPETDEWGDCGPNLATVAKLPPYPDGSQSPVETVIGSWGHDAWGVSVEDGDKDHIARHDPSRVLAECAAKRKIIGLHGADPANDKPVCLSCGDWWDGSPEPFPCPTLKALAAVYSSHEDYDSGWAL